MEQRPPIAVVETWVVTWDGERWRHSRRRLEPTCGCVHPHRVAERAALDLGLDPIVVHSTSWRLTGRRVVVTYLAVATGATFVDVHRSWPVVPSGRVTAAPACEPPATVRPIDGLVHAMRHLAMLATTDDAVMSALAPLGERADAALRRWQPAPATGRSRGHGSRSVPEPLRCAHG